MPRCPIFMRISAVQEKGIEKERQKVELLSVQASTGAATRVSQTEINE
jgi:hypothetical protein